MGVNAKILSRDVKENRAASRRAENCTDRNVEAKTVAITILLERICHLKRLEIRIKFVLETQAAWFRRFYYEAVC